MPNAKYNPYEARQRAASVGVNIDSVTVPGLVSVTGAVSTVGEVDTRDLDLDSDSVRQTVRAMTAVSVSKTGPLTSEVLVAVSGGSRIRLLRNAGHCDPATADGVYPVVTLKIGSTTIYADKLEAGLPWAETVCFEGADGEDLTMDLTGSETVFLNLRYELF